MEFAAQVMLEAGSVVLRTNRPHLHHQAADVKKLVMEHMKFHNAMIIVREKEKHAEYLANQKEVVYIAVVRNLLQHHKHVNKNFVPV